MNTYNFSRSISDTLNISFDIESDISDQEFQKIFETSDHQNISAPHSPETRKAISDACMGRIPWNKNRPDPATRERMIKNNPMFNVYSVHKMSQSKIGREPSNRIKTTFDWNCKLCKKTHTNYDTSNNKKAANFCNKSCAASYSNTHRYRCD